MCCHGAYLYVCSYVIKRTDTVSSGYVGRLCIQRQRMQYGRLMKAFRDSMTRFQSLQQVCRVCVCAVCVPCVCVCDV